LLPIVILVFNFSRLRDSIADSLVMIHADPQPLVTDSTCINTKQVLKT